MAREHAGDPHLDRFQSAPSRGGRFRAACSRSEVGGVSIRALAWRAIGSAGAACRLCSMVSIRAPSRGGRLHHAGLNLGPYVFQSAPSRGGRYGVGLDSRTLIQSFNPRPRVEGDMWPALAAPWTVVVSIRAPSRGGR